MDKISARKVAAKLMNPFYPGYGKCLSCGRAWGYAKPHITEYTEGDGCFALCVGCWEDLGVNERMPFYMELIPFWKSLPSNSKSDEQWEEVRCLIQTAVSNGL